MRSAFVGGWKRSVQTLARHEQYILQIMVLCAEYVALFTQQPQTRLCYDAGEQQASAEPIPGREAP